MEWKAKLRLLILKYMREHSAVKRPQNSNISLVYKHRFTLECHNRYKYSITFFWNVTYRNKLLTARVKWTFLNFYAAKHPPT